MANSSTGIKVTQEPKDGYDFPLYGIANGTFYSFHIPAIACIALSLVCVTGTLIVSFRTQPSSSFFKNWSKCDRFVVYLAICDGLFNISHITDHLHIVIAKEMVHHRWLCEIYGFNLTVFVTAQVLMVNVIAVNIFVLIYFGKNVYFGRGDWKLLSWTFGIAIIGATTVACLRQLGPNGTYCHLDGVNGTIAYIISVTIPILVILVVNAVFYILTIWKIDRKTRDFLAAGVQTTHQTINAARSLSLFVLTFIIQWWPGTVYGVWKLFAADIPQAFVQLEVTFSNLGGVLNLIVFVIIRRRKLFSNRFATNDREASTCTIS